MILLSANELHLKYCKILLVCLLMSYVLCIYVDK